MSLAAGMLSGCSSNFAPSTATPEQTPIGNIQGTVHGGQSPVSGAQIYLFAASTTGYGTSATSLITPTGSGVSCNAASGNSDPALNSACYVTTDASGNFALAGDYTCTSGQVVYMVAKGGNSGQGTGNTNSHIVQMAGIGVCPASDTFASQVPYLVINEVTTVAFGYAMSGFATTAYNVSGPSTALTAMQNAIANANKIVNLQYGQAPTVANGNANSVNPQQKIYALANILASCVNTADINPSSATPTASTQCQQLFKVAQTSAGGAATDEANAIFNIAHNQWQNVTPLWNLSPSTQVFSPTLPKGPADWSLPVIYNGVTSTYLDSNNNVTSGAFVLVFDGSGNGWIGDRIKGVIEVTPSGTTTVYNPGFGEVKGIALSQDSTQLWVADFNGGTNGTGQLDLMPLTGTSAGTISKSLTTNIDGPASVAVDANGNVFVANETNGSIVGADSTGAYINYSGALGITTPAWISLDQNGNAWLPSTTGNAYVERVVLNYAGNSGKFKSFGTKSKIAADFSYAIAVDSNNNIWFPTNDIDGTGAPNNENLEEIVRTKVGNTYTYQLTGTYPGYGYNGGGLGIPEKVFVDGANNLWMPNSYYATVSEYSQSLGQWLTVGGTQGTGPFGTGEVDATGYSNGRPAASGSVPAVGSVSANPDPSGNVWTANEDGSITQLIGIATPTAAPIYPGNFGVKP